MKAGLYLNLKLKVIFLNFRLLIHNFLSFFSIFQVICIFYYIFIVNCNIQYLFLSATNKLIVKLLIINFTLKVVYYETPDRLLFDYTFQPYPSYFPSIITTKNYSVSLLS